MGQQLLLAGDIGGTNSRFSLYERAPLVPRFSRTYPSRSMESLEAAALRFFDDARSELGPDLEVVAGALGVAGPVEGHVCRATNLPWVIDARRLGQRLSIPVLRLLNDFESIAHAIPVLTAEDLVAIGGGSPDSGKPIAILGPGTGLGQAFLLPEAHVKPGADALRLSAPYAVLASEGGHADFAPRTPIEMGLLQYLTLRYGRVSNERVLSGNGLSDIFTFLQEDPAFRALVTHETRELLATAADRPAVISRQAQAAADPVCQVALAVFASVLGAVAGNLALTVLATGGVYIAGGIAPQVVSFLEKSAIRDAFEHKGRFRPLVQRIPLYVVVRDDVGLHGSAAYASRLTNDPLLTHLG